MNKAEGVTFEKIDMPQACVSAVKLYRIIDTKTGVVVYLAEEIGKGAIALTSQPLAVQSAPHTMADGTLV